MFVGHGLLALAVVAWGAARLGRGRRHALGLGLLAASFATLPDLDVLYPLLAVVARAGPITDAPDSFWQLSTTVHRGATHSLVVGAVTAVGVTLWASDAVDRSPSGASFGRLSGGMLAIALLGVLVTIVGAVGGVLVAAMVAVMVVGALAIATIAARSGFGYRSIGAAALFGLSSHPFGDLVTGQPPPLLFPFDVRLLASRVELHGDPTLHLVGAFLFELAAIWLAVFVVADVLGRRPANHVRPRALAGCCFAIAVLAIPAPTLSAATGFVAGALAVGIVGVPLERRPTGDRWWDGLCTGLVAVTLAVLSYGLAYALF